MKTRLLRLMTPVFVAALLLTPSLSTAAPPISGTVADYPAGAVANGVLLSRHNLGRFGRVLRTDATTQVCVFCHTPHHSNTSAAPLWNRSTAQSVNYTAYGTTIAGTTVNKADLGGATLACLSCHDGTTTFDSLVNAPGKGGVVPGGDTTIQWSFKMPGNSFQDTTFDHFNTNTPTQPKDCLTCHGASPAYATGDTVQSLSLGFDLTNDHPVSVPYSASSKASLRPKSTVISAIDLSTGLNGTVGEAGAYLTNNLSQNRWAVSGFISSTATIGDLLRNNKVECSSCHDPHFRNLSYDEVDSTYQYSNHTNGSSFQFWCSGEGCVDGFFLRRVGGNTGSGVCRTCHDK